MSETQAKIRVLIVDDSMTTRENTAKLLFFSRDIEVVGLAETGQETLGKIAKLHPSVVVLDASLPGEDVSVVAEAIYESDPSIGLLLVSVEASAHLFSQPLPSNVRALLVKPIAGKALVGAVRHAAGGQAED